MEGKRSPCEFRPDELIMRKVKGHYELVDPNGQSVVSADTRHELDCELEELVKAYEKKNKSMDE